MTDEEIKRRLLDLEDGWTERKSQNVDRDDVRRTLVAFANSVPEAEEAILFIGVDDNGTPIGVDNPDKTQKTVRQWGDWCYPAIRHTSRVVESKGKHIVAVIVQPDHNRPHFAGPAYVRVGSETKEATEEIFDELIASRISKARPLLEAKRKGELVSVYTWIFGNRGMPEDYAVVECSASFAVFQAKGGGHVSADYERMRLGRSSDGKQLSVEINHP